MLFFFVLGCLWAVIDITNEFPLQNFPVEELILIFGTFANTSSITPERPNIVVFGAGDIEILLRKDAKKFLNARIKPDFWKKTDRK